MTYMYTCDGAYVVCLVRLGGNRGSYVELQGRSTKVMYYQREKAYTFALPDCPDKVTGWYFFCGPLAALGFFVAGLSGFALAVIINTVFWILVALLKRCYR